MPINSRRKGAEAERELFALMSEHLGVTVQRNLSQARAGGADAEADALPHFAVECKNVAGLERPTWWRQAIRQAEARGAQPALFYRRPRRRGASPESCWTAVLPAELAPHGSAVIKGPRAGVELPFEQAMAVIREYRP